MSLSLLSICSFFCLCLSPSLSLSNLYVMSLTLSFLRLLIFLFNFSSLYLFTSVSFPVCLYLKVSPQNFIFFRNDLHTSTQNCMTSTSRMTHIYGADSITWAWRKNTFQRATFWPRDIILMIEMYAKKPETLEYWNCLLLYANQSKILKIELFFLKDISECISKLCHYEINTSYFDKWLWSKMQHKK